MVCVAPGATKPVLGFTQYFLGAVVFTLKAISSDEGFVSLIVVGICFLSSTGNHGGRERGRRARQRRSRGRRLGARARAEK